MSKVNTLAPRLPLSLNSVYNYEMLTTIRQTTKQNFKCLVLTNPGERMMDPEFGVGITRLLFENYSPSLVETVRYTINTQASIYMPFIKIENIRVENGENFNPPDFNKFSVQIKYSILSVGIKDILNFSVQNNQR